MYVTDLDIKEFRGIKECRAPLKFTKFNILIGRNNSGKSAILQALSLLPHSLLNQPMTLNFGGNNKINFITSLVGGLSSLVYRYSGKATIDFKLMGKKYNISLDERGSSSISTDVKDVTGDYMQALSYLGIEQKEADSWSLYIPNDSEFLKKLSQVLFSKWGLIEKAEIHIKAVQELINPTITEKFTEVIRRDSSLFVRKEANGNIFYVDVRDLGDGIRKVLNVFLFIELCSPKLVLWDDFEVAAHPSLIRSLLSWLINKERQVFLATHSIDVIYELAEMQPANAQVIQLKKNAGDILTYTILTPEEVKDFLDAGSDPRLLVDAIK